MEPISHKSIFTALLRAENSRFTNASRALMYPVYGPGDQPQALNRHPAVKGCIHASSAEKLQDSGSYKGVRLPSGQDIFSQKLVLDPSFTLTSLSAFPPDFLHDSFNILSIRDVK